MRHKYFSYVLTIVTTNEKNFKYCLFFVRKIFNDKKVTISETKKLSKFVLDIYFRCQILDLYFMKKKIYSLEKMADVLIQPVKYRKKQLIACDMDMTIIDIETVNLINDKLLKNKKISDITEKAMSGKINFKKSILKRTKLLKGINQKKIINIIKSIKINEGVISVIKTLNNQGCHTMLISGGYDLIANLIGKKAGFREIKCNKLEIIDNKLTGKLEGEILDKEGKLYYLKNTMKDKNIKKNLTLAVGDGDNDIDMIKYASLGLAWKAYKKVKERANASINLNFKSILYFQGYSDNEIT